MATFTKHFSFIFLLILIFSLQIHARDSKFFNKISRHNNNSEKETQVVKEQEPNFLPENENGYGLYGHESGPLPPSTTSTNLDDHKTKPSNDLPNSKYLPKNYNPVAYVTVSEDNIGETKSMNNEFTTNLSTNDKYYEGVNTLDNNNQYYNSEGTNINKDDNKYYKGGTTNNNNNNNNNNDEYHNGGSTYYNNKNQQQGLIWDRSPITTYPNSKNNYYSNNQEQNNPSSYNHYNSGRVQQQGISDTRFLENGKYFYDVNSEKYARDSYENSREFTTSNNDFNSNFVENNNQNEEDVQLDDEEMP